MMLQPLLLIGAVLISMAAVAQRSDGLLRLMFYNLENYFEAKNDSLKPKREFAPNGVRKWTRARFDEKTALIYKTIAAVGGEQPPDIIGVCEVENRKVLEKLYYDTPLAKYDYGIVHRESPDRRGIDVGLLYRKSAFRLLKEDFIPIVRKRMRTRDILHACGIVNGLDTLHIMVVHMPSKYGGALASEPSRQAVAEILRHKIDSLSRIVGKLYLIVMGDFNDTPDSKSVAGALRASGNLRNPHPDSLYNLALPLHKERKGTLKYSGKWQMIDLALVSGRLLMPSEPLWCKPADYRIFRAPFLLEADGRRTDSIPRRTYKGMRHNPQGISDHLPIVLDIRRNW